jgi:HemK-related putative methylase
MTVRPSRPLARAANLAQKDFDMLNTGAMTGLAAVEKARSSVLNKLGLSELVPATKLNIAVSHHEHVEQQNIPARFVIDGITLDAPAGVYHPTANSSSLLFLRNLKAMESADYPKVLEIGAGCGAIALYLAKYWDSKVTASDISPVAVEAIRKNAELNDIKLDIVLSDLFESIDDDDFDLIVFNTPLIDKEPENSVEKFSLCDPGGRITELYLSEAAKHVTKNGMILVSICSNSAYEVLDDLDLTFEIVGFELSYSGVWWAVVGARR